MKYKMHDYSRLGFRSHTFKKWLSLLIKENALIRAIYYQPCHIPLVLGRKLSGPLALVIKWPSSYVMVHNYTQCQNGGLGN